MEKQVQTNGKTFEAKCQKCPSMLSFNWQVTAEKDEVAVTCAGIYPDCDLIPPEVFLKKEEKGGE